MNSVRKWILWALIPAMLLPGLSSCATTAPQVTDIGQAEAAPPAEAPQAEAAQAAWQLESVTVYFPEGSGPANADYRLSYQYPVFTGDGAQGRNQAVELWKEELLSRVSAERIPLADRAENEEAPSTEVACRVYSAAGYTNILFTESVRYGGEALQEERTLVLDGAGEETSLYAVSGLYEPEALLGQQVYNFIDKTDPERAVYYADVELADIEQALDLYNGFTVEEAGYTLYFPVGTLSDESQGPLRVSVSQADLYPDFVGESIDPEAYQKLLPALHALAIACGAEYRSFEGTPDALTYTLFMAQQFDARQPQNGVIRVPQAEYEALAREYFKALPADLAGGDGTALTAGEYVIPAAPMGSYGLRVDDCRREGDTLQFLCMLLYGAPGSANWGELSPVTAEAEKAPAAAAGYLLTGFTFER